MLPLLWLHPFASVTKNIFSLIGTLVLLRRADQVGTVAICTIQTRLAASLRRARGSALAGGSRLNAEVTRLETQYACPGDL
jgi:hypothetical protein